MNKSWKTRIGWIVLGTASVALLALAFQPTPVPVDVASIREGVLRISVDDDGWTRVRERYTITAPIQGRLLRTTLDPGDPVRAQDTVVAEFAPVSPDLLDARSRAEAEARMSRAEAAMQEMEARREQAAADLELATAELERARQLAQQGHLSDADLETRQRNERSAREGFRAAEFAVRVAIFEQEIARASLGEPSAAEVDEKSPRPEQNEPGEPDRRLRLQSPIHGQVLRVHEESARSLAAGSPILEVGNTALLEIVADYLTQDAVKVRPGMSVRIGGWGGESESGSERFLQGTVRVVEPGGFTKVSALGVEEQRVHVIVDPMGDPADWADLGDGYRVELSILLWEQDDVLLVPMGALFRDGETWATFVVEDGVAHLRPVTIGRRSALQAEVASGLVAGDQVILYPSGLLGDGMPVSPR